MSILAVIVWGNMRQPGRRRRWTNRHAEEEGAQTNRYPSGGGPGSDRRSGRQAEGGYLKGNRQFGDPVLPRSHHRRALPHPHPAPGSRSASLSARAGAGCALCGRAAGPGQTAFTLLGDGVPQSVASPRLRGRGRGGARRRRPSRLLTLPGNHVGAAGQRGPTVRSLKGAGTFYRRQLGGDTEALQGEERFLPRRRGGGGEWRPG